MRSASVNEYTGAQLRRLCAGIGLGHRADEVTALLADLIGPAGDRPAGGRPLWASDISDDHTPVEYSVAFEADGSHTLRLLVECVAPKPSRRANMLAALAALARLAARYPVCTDRLDAVRDLFLPEDPVGTFAMWFSIVVRADDAPLVKVYLNPEVSGRAGADRLVATGLTRLGLSGSHDWLRAHTPRPGSPLDRMSFFALDLADTPESRVKVYQSHHRATLRDVQRAAAASSVVDLAEIAEFGALLGGVGPYDGRPLVSSHTFLGGDSARPSGYSLYVPVRDYVRDDAEALARLRAVVDRYGLDQDVLDEAVRAVTGRPLAVGVGLIAHVSLRVGPPRPGITAYLSAEAFRVAPSRRARVGAA